MYYFFSAKLVYWKDEVVEALVMNEPPPEYVKNWWYGEKLSLEPYEFSFSIDDQALLLDNYRTASIFDLYSEKLISILSKATIKHELFPVKLFSKVNGASLNLDHKVFRLTEINDCLDENQSTFKVLPLGRRQIKALQQPYFKDAFLKSGKLLTRIAGHEKVVIIHEDLKKLLEDEKISGCKFSERRLDESTLFE
jgi:hypothetical protein